MNTTRKILTVYKEGAYRSAGVCIFNFFYHISVSLLHGADEVINFLFKNFPVTQEIPLDRWIEMECFQQTVSAKNLLSHCIPSKIALTAVCLPFGQPTYFERVLWNIRVTFLSYCVLKQNPLDWENGGYCSHNLKTEQESKDIQHRCSPQDAMRMGRCLGGGG